MKIIQPNIEFLSPYNGYFKKILCKCKLCQFEFQASPDHLYRDTKCPNCQQKHRKRTEQTYIEELKENNPYIELIPGTYINTKNDATFKCLECGYTWSTNAGHVLWDKTGCPICSKSKGEKEIAKILTNKNIKFIPQYELSVNFTNRRTIYVDFYLPDYNLFIEYNGEQHYISVKAFGGELTLNDQKLRDEQLRTYCEVNDIYLLEIPYTEYKNKTIQKTIEDKLIEFINLKNY